MLTRAKCEQPRSYNSVSYTHLDVYKRQGQPVDDMIREAAGIKKGSGKPHSEKVGKVTRAQLAAIAEAKKEHLNAIDEEGRIKVIAGTARSMGVTAVPYTHLDVYKRQQ